ncbi:MAG: transcription termination factor NusA [Candidatus Pacebacteria bacterium]|nr:transcription termination factor NusA [Candidatus Paceibacterota bacterium]
MIEELKNFTLALSQISEEKGLSLEKIIEVVEIALSAAYKKDFGKKGEVIKAKLNPQNGDIKFWQVLFVVDESMIYSEEELAEMSEQETEYEMEKEEELEEGKKLRFNPKKHIMIEEAKKIDPKISIGQELIIPLESKQEYGRIAAQTAKQVILQKLKEVERENIYQEFQSKIEEITSGIVQRIEGKNVFLNIGKTLGIMPPKEQIPQEYYKPGQRLKVLIREVQESPQGPMIILSRSYPKLVTKLFEIEVPEVSSGQVEIKAISREAGSRTKIAVFSNQEGIDPIGAMVGQRGTRVAAVINNLGGEKIDIVHWDEDIRKFIANGLSPAKVEDVIMQEGEQAIAIVPEDQLSLAIGKDGQNVRLAAKLTGWKIDVRSPQQAQEQGVETEKKEEEEKKEEDKEEKKEKKTKKAPAKKKTKKAKTKKEE